MLIRATRKNAKKTVTNTAFKTKTQQQKISIKVIKKVAKNSKAAKKATNARAAKVTKTIDPEKLRAR